MAIQTFAVIGAGTMGNGIAQVAAAAGLQVCLIDTLPAQLDRARAAITKSLAKFVEKGVIPAEQKDQALARITTATTLEAAATADFAVEAVFEDFGVKSEIFGRLDKLCRPEVILASNTSSIGITRLAAVTGRPDRVIGMHFMNPVPLMKLVEIIRGIATSDDTYRVTRELSEQFGKVPVEVNDYPGFISNRVLMPMINEAIFALMEGVAGREAIDTVMKLGMNHPMGPLTLADFIGLDVCLNILEVLYEGFRDPKYRPCPLLRKMVDAGWLGRKSGRGFYEYKS
jgi:3-hydroxybutyryl-CoA dehydrogenase